MTAETPAEGPGYAELAELLERAEPGKLTGGTFSIYRTDEGGLHVAYRMTGAQEDGHLPIPPAIVRMALGAASGRGPLAMLFGRMGGGG